MAAIALGASASSALAPRLLARVLGLDPGELTPTARLALGLFAARTAPIAVLALRGDLTARRLFLPTQGLDQLVWWSLHRRGELELRPTATLAVLSGAIVALDLRRRLRSGSWS